MTIEVNVVTLKISIKTVSVEVPVVGSWSVRNGEITHSSEDGELFWKYLEDSGEDDIIHVALRRNDGVTTRIGGWHQKAAMAEIERIISEYAKAEFAESLDESTDD